jgi:hypothetical protein
LGEVIASAKDSDEAVIQAIAGIQRDEEDRAPYCSPNKALLASLVDSFASVLEVLRRG